MVPTGALDLDVAVVGAGIAGLTVAAAVYRAGRQCNILEQTRLINDVGAGIQLAPNATRLLQRLGLHLERRAGAVPIEAIELRRWDDDTVLQRTLLGAQCTARFGSPYYTLHRADLHRELLRLIPQGSMYLGARVDRIEETPEEVRLHCADGTRTSANLAIGADGIHSRVRQALTTDRPRFSGQSIYRGVVPASRLPRFLDEPKVTVWLGPDQHCVCYPISGGSQLSFAATAPAREWDSESWSAQGKPTELMARYEQWNDRVRLLTSAAESVGLWALHDRDATAHWSSNRVTLIGDAAHPMLPFTAQGANQAVEDALALAALLHNTASEQYSQALIQYESIRMHRTDEIQRGSRRNNQNLHLPDGAEQRRRDRALARTGLNEQAWIYDYDAERAVIEAAADRTRREGV